jgi:hypothetical protein
MAGIRAAPLRRLLRQSTGRVLGIGTARCRRRDAADLALAGRPGAVRRCRPLQRRPGQAAPLRAGGRCCAACATGSSVVQPPSRGRSSLPPLGHRLHHQPGRMRPCSDDAAIRRRGRRMRTHSGRRL